MQEFMKGRHGMDELSIAFGGVGIALTVLATVFSWRALSWVALAFLLSALFRSVSKNLPARQSENDAFKVLLAKVPVLRGRPGPVRGAERPGGGRRGGRAGGAPSIGSGLRRARRTAQKMWRNRKTTKYFRCKTCGAMLSVPRGKGKIRITCPRCHTTVERSS